MIETDGSDGQRFRLADHLGSYVVLYFYPKSFTPTCARQTTSFRDVVPELRTLNALVVGVSTDDLSTQCDFGEQLNTSFPLLPDPAAKISREYDVLWPIGGIARRVTYVIEPDGTIGKVIWHELSVSKHLEGALEHIRSRKVR